MQLLDLVAALNAELADTVPHPSGVSVTGVSHQADWIRPGQAFVAIRGARFDGHGFIGDAIERGAVAVIGEGLPEHTTCNVPYLLVPDARAALADAATEILGRPSDGLTVIGVTGTDGKTTTSCLALHLLREIVDDLRWMGLDWTDIGTLSPEKIDTCIRRAHTDLGLER